eukprot:999310-Prymnesium_polylepis.2
MLGLYGLNTSGYIDLLLIHFPFVIKPECYGVSTDPACADSPFTDPGAKARQETWRAMEFLQKQGRVRAIGLSDYKASDLQETLDVATLPSARRVGSKPAAGRPSSQHTLPSFHTCDRSRAVAVAVHQVEWH